VEANRSRGLMTLRWLHFCQVLIIKSVHVQQTHPYRIISQALTLEETEEELMKCIHRRSDPIINNKIRLVFVGALGGDFRASKNLGN
jgi:hypothetical protein